MGKLEFSINGIDCNMKLDSTIECDTPTYVYKPKSSVIIPNWVATNKCKRIIEHSRAKDVTQPSGGPELVVRGMWKERSDEKKISLDYEVIGQSCGLVQWKTDFDPTLLVAKCDMFGNPASIEFKYDEKQKQLRFKAMELDEDNDLIDVPEVQTCPEGED